MRFKQIIENSTTAGSVATVAQPMMTQTRESVDVKGLKPVKQLMKGTKKKVPYANSIVEGKVKELAKDLKDLTSHQFQEKYKQSKADVRADMKKVNEDDLSEQDLIVIPGQGRLKRTGFVKHDMDHGEHEGETLKNSLHTIIRVATHLDKRLSLQSEFPEWVSEKIGAVKSNMVTVMDYLISSQEMQHDTDAMEGSENKYSNLSNRGVNRGINRAGDDFNRMLDLDQAESPHYKTQHQQDTKQRLKTKPMAGPKGVLPEGSQRVDSIVTDALQVMKGPEVSDAVLALKRVLGDRAYNERRGFYSFYVDQIHDMYSKSKKGVVEGSQLDEGAMETITALVKKIPGIGKYYQMAQQYKPQLVQILKTSKSGKEVKQKMEQLAAGQSAPVTESGMMKQLGGLALGGGSILSTLWMNAMGMIDGVLAHAAAGEVGGAVASGSILGLIPVTLMLFAAMLLFKGSKQSSDEKAQAFQAQRGQQGVAESDMHGDAEVSWEKGGRRAPTGAFRNPNFGNVLQKSVNKHNKAIVKTRQDIGSRIADIGPGGKEHNVDTDAAWDAAKKKVSEGLKK